MMLPRPYIFLIGLAAAFSGVHAAIPLQSLVDNSPFSSRQDGAARADNNPDAPKVEFRGIIVTEEGTLFGLYDAARNLSVWVKQNQTEGDFVVRSYDSASDSIQVDYQGRKLSLQLSSAKVAHAAPSPEPIVNNDVEVPSSVTIVAANPADQQRLEAVAAEVRRRRALRQSEPAAPSPGP